MSNVIKGYSIQNGEPTPDNPVEIESLDIEEDIKILEKFKNNEIERDKLERNNRYGGWKIGDIYKHLELNIAIENILAERKQDKARIKELEEALLKVKDKNTTLFITCRNSIPKQKVKDLIENETINISTFKYIAVEDLEELLEESE